MGIFISAADLAPFATIDPAKADAMIEDAEALAVLAAPALEQAGDLSTTQLAAVKAILRTALLRWDEAGTGAVTTQATGPFSMALDTRAPRYGGLTNGEVYRLRRVISGSGARARSVETAAYDGNATLGYVF
jgi:hypothetical protein